jgi:Rrf2 family protein
MKLITRNTDYALRAACYIAAQRQRTVSVPELVTKLHIPRHFLRKILQTLNQHNILLSHKGAGGGFVLARPADKIFLLDLIRVFQGGLKINECMFKKSPCPNVKICALRKRIIKIEEFAYSQFKRVTLSVLMKERKKVNVK